MQPGAASQLLNPALTEHILTCQDAPELLTFLPCHTSIYNQAWGLSCLLVTAGKRSFLSQTQQGPGYSVRHGAWGATRLQML